MPDLSIYPMDDYRRFLSSHLQFLSGLCLQAIKSANESVGLFLSSFFITGELLSPQRFQARVQSVVDHNRFNAPVVFNRALSLFRITNHANDVMSAYGSNFQFIDPWWSVNDSYSVAITRAITYENNCSCAVSMNCTTQARFITTDPPTITPIQGLKMGCTPNEAFLASTLECFYDSICLRTILEYTLNNNNDAIARSTHSPLTANTSRFSVDTTVIDLISELFIEKWMTSTDYLAYFKQCSPVSCSYSYVQRLDSLYTLTVILGLYGGLSVILKWVCPKIIRFSNQIYQWRRQRQRPVQPVSSMAMLTNPAAVQNANAAENITSDTLSTLNALTPPYYTLFLAQLQSKTCFFL